MFSRLGAFADKTLGVCNLVAGVGFSILTFGSGMEYMAGGEIGAGLLFGTIGVVAATLSTNIITKYFNMQRKRQVLPVQSENKPSGYVQKTIYYVAQGNSTVYAFMGLCGGYLSADKIEKLIANVCHEVYDPCSTTTDDTAWKRGLSIPFALLLAISMARSYCKNTWTIINDENLPDLFQHKFKNYRLSTFILSSLIIYINASVSRLANEKSAPLINENILKAYLSLDMGETGTEVFSDIGVINTVIDSILTVPPAIERLLQSKTKFQRGNENYYEGVPECFTCFYPIHVALFAEALISGFIGSVGSISNELEHDFGINPQNGWVKLLVCTLALLPLYSAVVKNKDRLRRETLERQRERGIKPEIVTVQPGPLIVTVLADPLLPQPESEQPGLTVRSPNRYRQFSPRSSDYLPPPIAAVIEPLSPRGPD